MKEETRPSAQAGPRPRIGGTRLGRMSLPGKYGHGLALNPQAETLSEALMRLSISDSLAVLINQHRHGLDIAEIEQITIEPAVTKVGELWLRGRVSDTRFDQISLLAENVERQFRMAIAVPGAFPAIERV